MRRFLNILLALLTIACAVIILFVPDEGVNIALGIFAILLFVYSIRTFIYYFSLARHMVGGQIILFIAVFTLCVTLFALNIQRAPDSAVSTILVVILIAAGVVDLLRAREAKKGGAPSWKFNMVNAIIEIVLAVLCQVFNATDPEVTSYVFAITMFYSGISRIVASFRRTNWSRIAKNASRYSDF